jgi:hypothetical protein
MQKVALGRQTQPRSDPRTTGRGPRRPPCPDRTRRGGPGPRRRPAPASPPVAADGDATGGMRQPCHGRSKRRPRSFTEAPRTASRVGHRSSQPPRLAVGGANRTTALGKRSRGMSSSFGRQVAARNTTVGSGPTWLNVSLPLGVGWPGFGCHVVPTSEPVPSSVHQADARGIRHPPGHPPSRLHRSRHRHGPVKLKVWELGAPRSPEAS